MGGQITCIEPPAESRKPVSVTIPLLPEQRLRYLCALTSWFDRTLLDALASDAGAEADALLASDLVLAVSDDAPMYQLQPSVRTLYLLKLRSETPLIELTLQTQLFEHFVQRLSEAAVGSAQRPALEEICFLHLARLALLLAEYMDWEAIAQRAEAVRALGPHQPEFQAHLTYYQGYVAIRTQRYQEGERTLAPLLARPEVSEPLRAYITLALGHRWWYQGEYAQAREFYEQALAAGRRADAPVAQAQATIALSMIYNDLGDLPRAHALASASLAIARSIPNRYRAAHALYEVGNNGLHMGHWPEAEAYCRAAIQLYEELGVEARLSMLYWNNGFLQHILGNEAASEASYMHTLERIDGAGAYELAMQLDTWLHLGLLYQSQGRWDEALAAYGHARALAKDHQHAQRLALIHYRCGNVFEAQGRLESAHTAYVQAIEGIERLLGTVKPEDIKLGLLGTVQHVYEAMVRLCLRLNSRAEAFGYVERARSRAFLDLLSTRPSNDDALLQKVRQRPVTLAEVQAALPAGTLLLEYFTIGVLPRGDSLANRVPPENTRLREQLTLVPQTLLFAITRERLDVFDLPLNPNTLRPQPGEPGPTARLLRDDLLPELYAQLLAPAARLLGQCSQLYLVPHGPLHHVPFLALHSAAGAPLLAAEGPAVALAPSATILLRSCLSRPRRRAYAHLALGYNNDQASTQPGALRQHSGVPLQYAEAEARHVARLIGGAAWAGPSPKSANLIMAGPHAQWLHIAGHAEYDPHEPLDSALYLGEGDRLTARRLLAELDLNADLVTLSACRSRVAPVGHGDELLGLQRAFLYAGAPAVVCALWETDDLVALLVMDRFYRGIVAGAPPAAALRDAQVAVRSLTGRELQATLDSWRSGDPVLAQALAHLPRVPDHLLDTQFYTAPRHWASFVLIGRAD
ncbi:hypothetical protein SE17_13335 [Kouleothrix aurantiaca]|uniref:CHAT domain-containing protein n=1 Tax=Kouleothrix aurantiaca TaxID=186479 RepID=A0A0P9D1J8_9CHLR|nr:hypothetical protein SE17_13335 [Kouleothrix aurantiaca]